MKVYLYINKQGFKENTFRVAFKELVKVVKDEQSKPTAYLVGKYEVRDYEHSYDVLIIKNTKTDILLYLSATEKKVSLI